jgi:predicted transcriptional regulator
VRCKTMRFMDRDASMTFRLPAAIREALQRAADAERRSLSSMAVLILEDGLTARGFLKAPKPEPKRRRS